MEDAIGSSLEVCIKHEEETNKVVGGPNLQIEEYRRVEEALRLQINEKNISCYKLEEEIRWIQS